MWSSGTLTSRTPTQQPPPEEATLAAASASSVAEARIRAAEARREAALRRLAAIRRGEPVPPAATPASGKPRSSNFHGKRLSELKKFRRNRRRAENLESSRTLRPRR